jgi:hypothetical protein
MEFHCPCPELQRDIAIAASFRNHCYTEGFDAAKHSKADIVLYDGARARVFCPIRHSLSPQLPNLVRGLPGKKVHQTYEQRNYVYSTSLMLEDQRYQIFFMLQRADGASGAEPGADLRLTVESAYPAAIALPKKPGAIRFNLLALKTLKRQTVRFGPR